MFIDINKIGPEGVHFDERVRPTLSGATGEDRVQVIEARLRGEVVPGSRGAELTARLEARVGLRCSRCLGACDAPIDAEFGLIVVRVEPQPPPGESESEVDEEDIDLFLAPDGRIDLGAIVREQIYLNLPLKPLCEPQCAGLCPTCGVDRNRIECDCVAEAVDPRLAPLLEFKRRARGFDGTPSGRAGNGDSD
jgi:uncharacterized protein